jgi:TolA-binding protein
MKSSFKNERLDAVKFCFGISPNLCEGGLSFLIEEDVKLDSFTNKFWTNFLNLANASKKTFPNLMGSIPRNMKLVFGSSDSQEELDRIFDAFNHFSQVFQNVCEEVLRETSSKNEKQNLKRAFDGEQYSLKQIVKLNFIPDKSLNKKFDVFKKKFASYLGNDYDYDKKSKERPPILQKIIAAAIDAFVANPTSAAGTDKNLKLIFGGRIASDLMYRDLSNLTVGQFREGYVKFIEEYNSLSPKLMIPKMENPENILDSGEPGSDGKSGSGAESGSDGKSGSGAESSPSSAGSNEKANSELASKTANIVNNVITQYQNLGDDQKSQVIDNNKVEDQIHELAKKISDLENLLMKASQNDAGLAKQLEKIIKSAKEAISSEDVENYRKFLEIFLNSTKTGETIKDLMRLSMENLDALGVKSVKSIFSTFSNLTKSFFGSVDTETKGLETKDAEDKKDAEPGGAEDKKDAEPGGAEDKKGAEPGGQTLSSLLFTRVDNNDLSKGYKAKRDEPGSKSSSIKQNLANLTATMTDIDPSGDLNKPSSINKKGRKQMMTYLSRLHKDLDGIKIESKLSDSEIILERWNHLAGLEN